MRILAAIVTSACLLAASPARADEVNVGGCLVGPMDSLNRCSVSGAPAAVMAGVAAPFFVAGAAYTIAHELSKQPHELPPGTVQQPNKKPSLSYVPPTAEDPYYNREHAPSKPSPAFKFNDTATNIATAVTAAAVVGAIIATVASKGGSGARR